MESGGEEPRVRPDWMVKYFAKDKFTARWCEMGSREGGQAGARTLEWDFGTSLTRQWASVQPDARKVDAFVLRGAPTADMDWLDTMTGGKLGVRTFVVGLLVWAKVVSSCNDGSARDDWERLACDCIRVLRVRSAQVGAVPRAGPRAQSDEEQTDPPMKRKR